MEIILNLFIFVTIASLTLIAIPLLLHLAKFIIVVFYGGMLILAGSIGVVLNKVLHVKR